jgi:TIGR03009 family protein
MPRSRMIRFSPLIALLASTYATAHAQEAVGERAAAPRAGSPAPAARATQPGQAQAQPVNDPRKMKWLLEKWAGQSSKLKTLDVKIYRIDKDPKWKDEEHFEGRAMFKSPNLAYLDFAKIKVAKNAKGQLAPVIDPKTGKRVTARSETIVCGQTDVWQYLHESRQIYIYPLAKGERQRALDEGPLPFLFNMKVQEAEERYSMSYVGENEKYYAVKVYPRTPEDKQTFKVVFIYLDKTFLLPARMILYTPDGRVTRDFTLEVIKPNAEVKDVFFQGGVFKNWKVVKDAGAGMAQQGRAAAPAGGAGAMPRR